MAPENARSSRGPRDRDAARLAKWTLAQSQGITLDEARRLSSEEDAAVLSALATNYAVNPTVLSALSDARPELRHLIAMNVNAPAELKAELPLAQHVESALTEYLNQMQASDRQRAELRELYLSSIRAEDNKTTLAEAWARISRSDY